MPLIMFTGLDLNYVTYNCLAVISMNVWLSQMSVYESIQSQIDTYNTDFER